MKGRRLTTKWLLNLRLSTHEAIMLRLLRAGMPMEAIADELNTSVKSLYRKRTALSERLGAENFNEACLFIFKNKLLDADNFLALGLDLLWLKRHKDVVMDTIEESVHRHLSYGTVSRMTSEEALLKSGFSKRDLQKLKNNIENYGGIQV
ncbi:hypothetical protein L1887_44195 [Cichorium endivia]|nr:hypothetical protein L1887_44195 [Cichorium endivia]